MKFMVGIALSMALGGAGKFGNDEPKVKFMTVRTGLNQDYLALDRMDQRGLVPDSKFRSTADGTSTNVYILDCGISMPSQVASELSSAQVITNFWSFDGLTGDTCDQRSSLRPRFRPKFKSMIG